MRGLGYQLSTWYDADDPNRDLKHIPPLLKEGAPIVELHWTILEEEEPFTIDVDGMWARSVPAEIAGVGVRGLSVEDLLLHLSLHFSYQHRLRGGLRNLYDMDAVIRGGEVDWTTLTATAQEWGGGARGLAHAAIADGHRGNSVADRDNGAIAAGSTGSGARGGSPAAVAGSRIWRGGADP